MTLRALTVLPLLASTGCYFFYPQSIPKLPGPLIEEGAQISIDRSEEAFFRDCRDDEIKSDQCQVRNGKLRFRYVSYQLKATYGGRELTQGEFYQLTLAGYNDGIRAVLADKGTCNISKVPSVIAMLGGVFAMVVLATGDAITENDSTKLKLYGVGAGTALVGFGASYPLGGYACRRAGKRGDRLGEGLDQSARKGFSSLDSSEIDELERLAEAFNSSPHEAASGGGATAPAEPTDAPTDAPAGEPTGSDDVVSTLKKDGRFKTFLRLATASGLDVTLRAGTHTVFAPTDRTFAKATTAKELDELVAEPAKLRKLLEAVVVEGTYTSEQLLAEEPMTAINGARVRIRNHDGKLTSAGSTVVVPPLPASNGLIYATEQ